nr:hypothetical protein [Tanacetum cinerariifolium]
MSSAFVDTHNMVAILTKSEAIKGFDQIINFLNGSYIQYALTVNPHIYISCIKQFWNTVTVKQSNDVTRLQALVDRKKVVITETVIRDVLHLDDAKGVDCLPNKEIFAGLARMGYEKPSIKVHSIDYPESNRVGKGCSGVKTPLFEGMLVAEEIEEQDDAEEQIQGNDNDVAQVADAYVSRDEEALDACAALTRRVEHLESGLRSRDKKAEDVKVIAEVLSMHKDKPEVQEVVEVVTTGKLITEVVTAASAPISAANTIIPTAKPNIPAATITAAPVKVTVASTRRRKGVVIRDPKEESSAKTPAETKSKDKEKKAEDVKVIAGDAQVKGRQAEIQAEIYQIDMDHPSKVLSMHEDEPEVQEVVEVVTTGKLITEVVTAASAPISAASTIIPTAKPNIPAATITAAPVKVTVASTRRRKGVRYQVIKKRPQTEAQARRNMIMYLKNTTGFILDYFKGMSYDDIRPIFEAKFNSNIEFLLKSKEQIEEEENRALESINETPA